jgi:flagellar protein FlaG
MLISQINANGFTQPVSGDVSPQQRPVAQDVAVAPAAHVEIPVKAVQAVASTPSAEQVKQAVEHVNKVVQTLSNDLKFTLDEDTGMRVVKVVDVKSQDVIRQIPSEEVVAIAKALDTLQGLIIRQKA